jgi:exportin-5
VVPGRRAAAAAVAASAAASSADTGDYATACGATVASARAWLRHIREYCYHTLGMLPTHCPAALDVEQARALLTPSMATCLEYLDHQTVRMALRHVAIPLARSCPTRHLQGWTAPLAAAIVPHLRARLGAAWAAALPQAGALGERTTEGSAAAEAEIVADRLMRELTTEFAEYLRTVATRSVEDPMQRGARPGTSMQASVLQQPGAASAAAGPPAMLLQLILEVDPTTGFACAAAAAEGMRWADASAFRFSLVCRALVPLAPRDVRLYAFVGSEVLKAAIASLASEAMATHKADILGLIRDVLVQQLPDPASAAHAALLSLPGMTPEKAGNVAKEMSGIGSEKAQRDAIKRALVEACGRGSFAALADWRPPGAVALSEPRRRSGAGAVVPGAGEEVERLQGDITRALFAPQ